MRRKRKNPTPNFRMPPPFNPMTGERADLVRRGVVSRCAMMQVIGDDETEANQDNHDNYVVCRGFDPETKKFYHSIAVAKPYSLRSTYPYRLGQLFAAMKAATRLGNNPGVSATTVGQPADLDEVIEPLLDDDSKPVYWLDIENGQPAWEFGKVITAAISVGGSGTVELYTTTDGVTFTSTTETWEGIYASPLLTTGTIAVGKWVRIGLHARSGLWFIIAYEC